MRVGAARRAVPISLPFLELILELIIVQKISP